VQTRKKAVSPAFIAAALSAIDGASMSFWNESDPHRLKQDNFYSPQLTMAAPLPVCTTTGSLNEARRSAKDEYEQPDLSYHQYPVSKATNAVGIYRVGGLKFSAGDKLQGTAEEYKDASLRMSVHFGHMCGSSGAGPSDRWRIFRAQCQAPRRRALLLGKRQTEERLNIRSEGHTKTDFTCSLSD
jgi:hypothetical protein